MDRRSHFADGRAPLPAKTGKGDQYPEEARSTLYSVIVTRSTPVS